MPNIDRTTHIIHCKRTKLQWFCKDNEQQMGSCNEQRNFNYSIISLLKEKLTCSLDMHLKVCCLTEFGCFMTARCCRWLFCHGNKSNKVFQTGYGMMSGLLHHCIWDNITYDCLPIVLSVGLASVLEKLLWTCSLPSLQVDYSQLILLKK